MALNRKEIVSFEQLTFHLLLPDSVYLIDPLLIKRPSAVSLREKMNLYRGVFKLHNGPVILYRHAASEKQAWLKFCMNIAKNQGVDQGIVCRHFDYSKMKDENFEIKIEIEYTEVDDETE